MEPERRDETGEITMQVDGLPCRVRKETDLRWLQRYGRVFRVMDFSTSGNLCFGVEGPYGRLFIKYAGAWTLNGPGRPEEAVRTLREAMPLYGREHPALTRLLAHGAAGDGYAAIFRWAEGQALRTTPPDPKVYERLRHIQPLRALKMLDGVYDLHAALAEDGYIAVDFHDGNLLIDFERDEALVCDIDLYRKKPAVNDRGRMPGSARFMAPEEFTLGAPLNESTTVYAMGALAFAFFGDPEEKGDAGWFGPAPLLPVARKAVAEKPLGRYATLQTFLKAWREAVGRVRF